MERSLLFFYGILSIALMYCGYKLAKDKYKWHSIVFLVSFFISLVIASSFSSLSTGIYFLLVMASTFIILFTSTLLLSLIKYYSVIRYVSNRTTQLQHISPVAMVKYLMTAHDKKLWYVLYLPLEGIIEIGVGLFNPAPEVDKKFHIKTLAGRHIYITPEYILKTTDLKSSIICTFQDFYKIDHQARTLVDDYILRIKNGHKEPWFFNQG